jgi:adenylylsulfate kinase-like enzyme
LLKERLLAVNLKVEIIDGDEFRKTLCADLGFSKEDRIQIIHRHSFYLSHTKNLISQQINLLFGKI